MSIIHGRSITAFARSTCLIRLNSWLSAGGFFRYSFLCRLFRNLLLPCAQFVVFKPIFAIVILSLKTTGAYSDGRIAWDSSYVWISLAYNASVCVALYSLVVFYTQCARDLRPYRLVLFISHCFPRFRCSLSNASYLSILSLTQRPLPKFLCVKAIIFFSFWQGFAISFLVAFEVIPGGNDALALQDALICLEMIPFSIFHWIAFSVSDYDDDSRLSSRLTFKYAVRDAFGIKVLYLAFHL